MITRQSEIARRLLILFAVAAALFHAAAAWAEPVRATITSIDGTKVQAQLGGKTKPSVGDTATIGFEIDGVGLIPLKGTWRVERVSGATVTLKAQGNADQPRVGQIATIEATKRVAADPAKPSKKGGKVSTFLGEPFDGSKKPKGEPARRPVAPPELSRADIEYIQRRLNLYGYNAGVPDGVIGNRTRNAIRAFQRDRKMSVDGRATTALKDALRAKPETRRTAQVDRRSSKDIERDAYNYQFGKGGRPKDYAKFLELNHILVQRDYAPGIYAVGVAYAFGYGVKKDYAEARRWFERAANKGHARALYNLAVLHRKGLGVKKDPTKARDYMHRAAAAGLQEAYYSLGVFYESGVGGHKSRETAISWYRQAAAKGNVKAQEKLTKMGLDW